jgi:hypothetical protein
VETHLQTQELVEVSVAPKPITLTRAEIYAMHNTLRRELDLIVRISKLAWERRNANYVSCQAISTSDPLRPILEELGGVPNVLYQEGQTAPVTFSLTNRFSAVSSELQDRTLFQGSGTDEWSICFPKTIPWPDPKQTGYKRRGTSWRLFEYNPARHSSMC